MNLTNEQVNTVFDLVNTHIAMVLHSNTANHVDRIVYKAMNLFSSFERILDGEFEVFWREIDNSFTNEALEAMGANDIVQIINNIIKLSDAEISEVKGLFSGRKIKKIHQKYAEDFISRLDAMGGIDYLTDNYFMPYVLDKYQDIIDFGF